jgi:hypothetical protein
MLTYWLLECATHEILHGKRENTKHGNLLWLIYVLFATSNYWGSVKMALWTSSIVQILNRNKVIEESWKKKSAFTNMLRLNTIYLQNTQTCSVFCLSALFTQSSIKVIVVSTETFCLIVELWKRGIVHIPELCSEWYTWNCHALRWFDKFRQYEESSYIYIDGIFCMSATKCRIATHGDFPSHVSLVILKQWSFIIY